MTESTAPLAHASASTPATPKISPNYFISRWLFVRGLGLIYLIAFISLWSQIDGLVGRQGILPTPLFLAVMRLRQGFNAYWQFPTLSWLHPGDGLIHLQCLLGVIASMFLIAGRMPRIVAVAAWVLYLSLITVGQVFFYFQWDILLLETGLLAIFFVPGSKPALWLLRWLLFRVMFMSGLLKLTCGDPNWLHLTALQYHYLTQPLPTWTSWYFHQFPAWFHTISALFMYLAELIAPLLIFGPRRLRLIAFWLIVALQFLIATTGNYGFFNLLTILLCLTLFDDAAWPERLRNRLKPADNISKNSWRISFWLMPPLIVYLIITLMYLAEAFFPRRRIPWPTPLADLRIWVSPLRSANSYGLFRIMTTSRPQIVLEGSNDGDHWREYQFKWQAARVDRPPAFCEPHMPRLDWQLWFAGLEDYQNNPWFIYFMARVMQGSPPVLSLLDENPFPDHPPKYLRATLYDYRFTDSATRRATGAWWSREIIGPYCPIMTQADVLDSLPPPPEAIRAAPQE